MTARRFTVLLLASLALLSVGAGAAFGHLGYIE